MRYIEPTREAVRAFLDRDISGPVVMLNLLRFRATADYASSPELAPATPVTGVAAYNRYLELARPFVAAAGGELAFLARGGAHVIGPPDERWDAVLLVRQRSVSDFLAFTSNEGYQRIVGHRTAALEDSRLLPMVETDRL
jgi:uncharacterized protein (DUF1330 family)